MKKVYMPSDEILSEMQSYGANIYQYLMIKAYETLVIEGVNYPSKGILKTAYKYICENPDLAPAICSLFPEEIKYSEVAMNDGMLAERLITSNNDRTIYNLDNLAYFDKSIGNIVPIVKTTVDILDEYLPKSPAYRFSYKQVEGRCHLLDDIFSTKVLEDNIFWNSTLKEKLSRIEPAYALLIPTISYQDDFLEFETRKKYLREGIKAYAARYYLENVKSRPVDLKNPDVDTKRLIRCIKNDKINLY